MNDRPAPSQGRVSSVPLPSSPQARSSPETPPQEAFEIVREGLSYASRPGHGRSLVGADVDWEVVQREARRHRVLPLFLRRLAARAEGTLPSAVQAAAQEHRRAIRIRNTFLAKELGRIARAFREANVPALALKGPVLAKAAFGDIAARHSVDVDVVIPRERFSEAGPLLRGIGYEHAAKRAGLTGWRKAFSLYLDGQWEFTRGASFTLDLHTRIMPPGYAFPVDLTPFWERSRPVQLTSDVTVPGFAPADRVLVLAHHGVKNQWRALRHVADVAGAVSGEPDLDWSLLRERARALGATRTTRLALYLAHDLLGGDLPSHVLDWVEEQPIPRLGARMESYLRNRHQKDHLTYRERVHLQLGTKDTLWGQLRYGAHSVLQHVRSHLL